MPLIDENRIITSLGLKQMKVSTTSALRKYIENLDREIEWDADIIGFQIGPRINAAGRMDSPLKALHWLLADESRVDDWLDEVEMLNTQRQEIVKELSEAALLSVDEESPILFFTHRRQTHRGISSSCNSFLSSYWYSEQWTPFCCFLSESRVVQSRRASWCLKRFFCSLRLTPSSRWIYYRIKTPWSI